MDSMHWSVLLRLGQYKYSLCMMVQLLDRPCPTATRDYIGDRVVCQNSRHAVISRARLGISISLYLRLD